MIIFNDEYDKPLSKREAKQMKRQMGSMESQKQAHDRIMKRKDKRKRMKAHSSKFTS